jgi:hypothetical protein
MEMAVNAQHELITMYEMGVQSGKDMGVRTWAKTKQPAIRQNLEKAQPARKST